MKITRALLPCRSGKGSSFRRVIALLAVAATALTFVPAGATHSSTSVATSLNNALAYLRTAMSADGSIGASVGATADLVFAIRSGAGVSGVDQSRVNPSGAYWTVSGKNPVTFLESQATTTALKDAALLGKLVLAVKAAGRNPAAFGGLDLVLALRAKGAGGRYGATLYDQALAVLALRASGQSTGDAEAAHLLYAQGTDGAFGYAPVLGDPALGSDSNSTALALQSLDVVGGSVLASRVSAATTAAVAWLHDQQRSDAGFEFCCGFGSDANSTAYVVQGLRAAGQFPDSAAWTKSGATPVTWLLTRQQANGSWSGFDAVLSTVQAVPGVVQKTLVCIAAAMC